MFYFKKFEGALQLYFVGLNITFSALKPNQLSRISGFHSSSQANQLHKYLPNNSTLKHLTKLLPAKNNTNKKPLAFRLVLSI